MDMFDQNQGEGLPELQIEQIDEVEEESQSSHQFNSVVGLAINQSENTNRNLETEQVDNTNKFVVQSNQQNETPKLDPDDEEEFQDIINNPDKAVSKTQVLRYNKKITLTHQELEHENHSPYYDEAVGFPPTP